MSKNHKNIIGTEMEWAVMGRLRDSRIYKPLNGDGSMPMSSEILKPGNLPDGIDSHGSYMSNGSRFYGDVGGHVEYATPENLSLDDVVLSEFAGEKFVAEVLRRYVKSSQVVDEVLLYKRVVDDHGTTWGYHVNVSEERKAFALHDGYSLNNRLAFEDRLRPLLFHYATSLPLLGAGAVYAPGEPGEYKYSLGQKHTDIQYDVNGSTTSSKPFISTRDEPHADHKYIRLHIVGTDPHVSPWATRMMMGTTTLMLAGIKQGVVRELEYDTGVHSPAASIVRRAKYDIYGEQRYGFRTADGVKYYADYDVQSMYIDDLSRVKGMTDDQKWSLEEWQKATEDRRSDVMKLSDRSDTIAKLDLIQTRNRRAGRKEDEYTKEASDFDKAYSTIVRVRREDVDGGKSTDDLMNSTVAGVLRRTRFAKHMPAREDLNDRILNAPKNTRASVRGTVIGDVTLKGASPRLHNLEWGYYSIYKDGVNLDRINMDPWTGVE